VEYSDDITSRAAGAERESGTDNAASLAPSGTHPVSAPYYRSAVEQGEF